MKFKTNAKCAGCVGAITGAVKNVFPNAELSMDLESADKLLHVHGIPENDENAAKIVKAIEETGFQGSYLTRGEENK